MSALLFAAVSTWASEFVMGMFSPEARRRRAERNFEKARADLQKFLKNSTSNNPPATGDNP